MSLFTDKAELSTPLVLHGSDEENAAKEFWASCHAVLGEATSEFVNVIDDEGNAVLEWRTTADIFRSATTYSSDYRTWQFERRE
ncbi:nuclear transport factor 2 family protein [Endobacterium cereale]|uniref:nuclear transport factor 2 family protein n=1 Tax=Endobacterium cereale TaxID=2663029 RepID=UPI003B75CB1A